LRALLLRYAGALMGQVVGRGVVEVLDSRGLEETSCGCCRVVRARYDRLLPGSFG
jgi:hypothetical protein